VVGGPVLDGGDCIGAAAGHRGRHDTDRARRAGVEDDR
jgi:hypothetical protein